MKKLGDLLCAVWNWQHTLWIVLAGGTIAGGIVGYMRTGRWGWTIGGVVIGFVVTFIVGCVLEVAINGFESSGYDDEL